MTISYIQDLQPGDTKVTVQAKVLKVELSAETTLADETTLRVANILLADKTGTVVFSARGAQIDRLKPGSWVNIDQGQVELSFGHIHLTTPGQGVDDIKPIESPSDQLNLSSNITQYQYQYSSIYHD
ncbi:hypothetical protein K493DRAFT_317663 [Basidiobolus meristosporus CBS 931.73]|uniref:Single-stranded DNA binding protein Ssb-like OB fold domain-containing protein n=1 Tax=Basidiobolus meristosporus CBS 931.73 TaxID=1314790 RepID=A0A1Y1XYV6_9FUNG|nr:hypothetical protein K493DRAFT_317663 [Basidiobolus meristosporus CBS 931.73]|eukprot:ORX90902.1 hypothetical protein K493DRAFT_317663 [Basidiobolus meristosporus CBS 931.73]